MMRLLGVALLLAAPPLAGADVGFLARLRATIEGYLGRPYVWGAAGIKSFDCSGFVWRVATDNGMFLRRTTARKLWFSTRPVSPKERGQFGNLLFFDDLRHVGIVNDARSFYHAQSSKGTNLSELTGHWKSLVVGEHRFFTPPGQ